MKERLQKQQTAHTLAENGGGATDHIQLHSLPHTGGAAHLPDGMHTQLWCTHV